MLDRYLTPEHAARDLLSMHGRRARQIIVDEIVKAIRDADMDTAKTWDRIGQEVDALMLSQSAQPIPSDDDRRIPQTGRDVGGDSRHP